MTEQLPPFSTQIVPPSQNATPAIPPASAQNVPHKVEAVEEEPYTMKCICKFSDDDGSTIYCETCETWQHIECYYPHNLEDAYQKDFAHSCVDCDPRPLDRELAIERQRSRLANLPVVEAAAIDKKAKRPPAKSHKKKPKPTEIHVPAQSTTDASKQPPTHDQHPPKKTKNTHKSSQSISSQAPKRSPPFASGRASITHGHPPSPATTPPDLPQDFEMHSYSPGFLSLHSNPTAHNSAQTNSYASLNVSNTVSLWLREPAKLRQDTGQEFNDVFRTLPANIDSIGPPRLQEKKVTLATDTSICLHHLTTPTAVEKDAPLIELRGMIGFQKDYCADKSNRWLELSSPLPFVFFHDMLPLYIDTRNEGSTARYVRRSCKPNAVLDTFISGGSEYQFWLMSDRHIAANEQITIAWDFRWPKAQRVRMLHLLGLADDDYDSHDQPEMDDAEYQSLASWIHLLLSEYGGCACDLGSNCAFARFHRIYLAKLQARNTTKKKSRKTKTHTISPTSTGHATNSRAASEGRPDDGPDADGASISGSARSKPPSRDMTPAHTTPAPRQGSFDTLGILTEPTDRDKRKVAMVEDSFRRMEQHPAPPRKKKRVSDGTNSNSTSKAKTKGATGHLNGVHYVDAGTSRSKSGSPTSAVSPSATNPFKQPSSRHNSVPVFSRHASAAPRSNYCDASVQTDPVEGEWYSEAGSTPVPRRKIKSLSKRLLENRHRVRQEEETRRKRESTGSQSTSSDAMVIDSLATSNDPRLSAPPIPVGSPAVEPQAAATMSAPSETSVDTPMTDAPALPITSRPLPPVLITEPSPGTSAKMRSPELRVQMPPVPSFNGTVSAVSSATTPVSANGSVLQSPFSSTELTSPFPLSATNGVAAANPSPVKKKLSLSDYTKSRKAAAGRPSVGTSLKTATSNPDDPKSATSVEGPAISESPSTEKANDAHQLPAALDNAVNVSSS